MTSTQSEAFARRTGRPVPIRLLLWLSLGTVGSILFTTVYLVEGATRPGYSGWQQAISALSLGPGGWIQQINFIVFGGIIFSTAFTWHIFLKNGVGAISYPILRALEGFSLIMDGFFSQDPAGYPQGVVLATTTSHAVIHQIFAFVSITAIAVNFFIIARRFTREPGWRGWTLYSALTGLLTIVFIATFGALSGQHSAIAGLFERLSTSLSTLWGIAFLVRLWAGAGFGVFQNQTIAPVLAS